MATTNESATDAPLLFRRFPKMLDADASPQWFPLPSNLPAFLAAHVTSHPARWLILELFQHLAFDGGVIARVGDVKLAARMGVGRSTVQDARAGRQFRRLVTVAPGEAKSAKKPDGVPNVYDLTKLMLRLNSWAAPPVTADEADQELRRLGAVIS